MNANEEIYVWRIFFTPSHPVKDVDTLSWLPLKSYETFKSYTRFQIKTAQTILGMSGGKGRQSLSAPYLYMIKILLSMESITWAGMYT